MMQSYGYYDENQKSDGLKSNDAFRIIMNIMIIN